jgi:hypothetical protein
MCNNNNTHDKGSCHNFDNNYCDDADATAYTSVSDSAHASTNAWTRTTRRTKTNTRMTARTMIRTITRTVRTTLMMTMWVWTSTMMTTTAMTMPTEDCTDAKKTQIMVNSEFTGKKHNSHQQNTQA